MNAIIITGAVALGIILFNTGYMVGSYVETERQLKRDLEIYNRIEVKRQQDIAEFMAIVERR